VHCGVQHHSAAVREPRGCLTRRCSCRSAVVDAGQTGLSSSMYASQLNASVIRTQRVTDRRQGVRTVNLPRSALATVTFALLLCRAVSASCPLPQPERNLQEADLVFIGKVQAVQPTGERVAWPRHDWCFDLVLRATLEIEEVLKGHSRGTTIIYTAEHSKGCATSVPPADLAKGRRYIVFAALVDGRLQAQACITRTADGREDEIEELRSLARDSMRSRSEKKPDNDGLEQTKRVDGWALQ
jgi:hypothetical protein